MDENERFYSQFGKLQFNDLYRFNSALIKDVKYPSESGSRDEAIEGIPKEVLEGALEDARKIGQERKAFRRMLETYVPLVSHSIPQNARILNVGCGRCNEGLVLSGYFGGKPYGYDSKDVFLVGIDIDEENIEKAKREYTSYDFSGGIGKRIKKPNYTFIHGDARRLRELVSGEFDVIVARHPNVAEIPAVWNTIFRESNGLMNPEGLFLATSFFDTEHQMLEEQVKNAGYKISLSTSNAYVIPLPHKEISIDRKVLLARK